MKYRVFISSVQSEFARERKSLAKYIREDALLGDFFEVFLFEEQPAKNRTAKSVFLEEVAACDLGPRGITVEDLYRTHDSIPRNSLIARAMSWTSYVEKSGSGTGEILDKCVEYGLARPEFDPTTGFFKTIIWRAGIGNRVKGPSRRGLVRGPSHVGPKKRAQEADPRNGAGRHPVGTQSRHPVEGASQGLVEGASQGLVKVLHVLVNSEIPLSSTVIAKAFGKERANSYIKRLVASLVDDGLAETTGERKRGARLQKYRLTAKGRKLAAPLAKNTAKPKGKGGTK